MSQSCKTQQNTHEGKYTQFSSEYFVSSDACPISVKALLENVGITCNCKYYFVELNTLPGYTGGGGGRKP